MEIGAWNRNHIPFAFSVENFAKSQNISPSLRQKDIGCKEFKRDGEGGKRFECVIYAFNKLCMNSQLLPLKKKEEGKSINVYRCM